MSSNSRARDRRRIAYLCLQVTKEGQASYAHVHEIIAGLRRRGMQVDLFEPRYTDSRKHGSVYRALKFASAQLRLLFCLHRYDLLYIRSHYGCFPTALVAKLLRVPVIQEVNGTYDDLFTNWPWTRRLALLFKTAARLQWRWADSLITVARQMGQWVEAESGNSGWYVVPNGANTELFRPTNESDGNEGLPEGPYVVFFGTLSKWQGLDGLLEAASHVDWPSDVSLVIVGAGTERSSVLAAATRNSLIAYLGQVPYRRVPAIVAKSIVSVSPQTLGGLRSVAGMSPLKLYESMACGVPVVMTDIPESSDIVRQEHCGLIIPDNNPAAIARAVKYLREHPVAQKQMGRNGRLAACREHSWDKRAAKTQRLILATIAQRIGQSFQGSADEVPCRD